MRVMGILGQHARATPAQSAQAQACGMPDTIVDLVDPTISQTGIDDYNQVWAVSNATSSQEKRKMLCGLS